MMNDYLALEAERDEARASLSETLRVLREVMDDRDRALALLPKIRPCVEWARDECETPEVREELTTRLAEIDALLEEEK